MNYPKQEHAGIINGVNGRFYTVHEPVNVRGNMAHLNQTWESEARKIAGYGTAGQIKVTIRFDDCCKNGHQTFSITAGITTVESRKRRDCEACGCLHDEIAVAFPELAPLIKWHLFSTDGPMHYIANTVYHAGNRDCHGLEKGHPRSYDKFIYFGNSPVGHKISDSFAEFLLERKDTGAFNIIEIAHDKELKTFSSNFTFAGYGEKWHLCPFKNRLEAEEWKKGLENHWCIENIPTLWSEGKERDFTAARNAAVWPDATNEILSLPKEELTEILKARLPGLIAEFKTDMDKIGFLWEVSK